MRRSVVRALGWVLAIVVLAAAVGSLGKNWNDLRSQPLDLDVRPTLIAAAMAVVWLSYAGLIAAWRSVAAGWGTWLHFEAAARIWIVSGLGKYVPGRVWAVAGMAVMAQRAGLAAWAATAAAIVLQALGVASAAAVIAVTGMESLSRFHPFAREGLLGLAASSIAGVALLLWPPFLRRVLGWVGISVPGAPAVSAVAGGLLANAVAWLGYGTAVWLLARGLFAGGAAEWSTIVAAFTASYVAGLLAVITPGGLGVREGVFILMMQQSLGVGPATAVALAARVLFTVTELGAAVPFLARAGGKPGVAL